MYGFSDYIPILISRQSMEAIKIAYWEHLFSLSRPKRAIEKNTGHGSSQKCYCSKEAEYG